MKLKVLKKHNKKIRDFEKKEWDIADQEHYGKILDWSSKKFAVVAYEKTEMIGVIEFSIKVGVADIQTLIVSSTERGKGIGKALLTKTEEIAKKNDAHKLHLITGKGWKAEDFYKNFGMLKTADLPNHYINRDFVAYSKFI